MLFANTIVAPRRGRGGRKYGDFHPRPASESSGRAGPDERAGRAGRSANERYTWSACKPGSVPLLAGARRPFIWPRRCRRDRAAYPGVVAGRTDPAPIFGLASGGVCRASRSPGCWCALTAPFHPYRGREQGTGNRGQGRSVTILFPVPCPLFPVPWPRRFTFCCTVPVLADGGRYPPPCPVKPGLSSARRTRRPRATAVRPAT